MSKLEKILSPELMVVPMRATDSESALSELIAPLLELGIIDSELACLQSILKRERRMSTGVGKGVALPHGLCSDLKSVVVVFGISHEGVDFRAVDGLVCHIFVLLLSPTDDPEKHLKLLSRFTKMLSDGELRSKLVAGDSPQEVYDVLDEYEEDEDEDL